MWGGHLHPVQVRGVLCLPNDTAFCLALIASPEPALSPLGLRDLLPFWPLDPADFPQEHIFLECADKISFPHSMDFVFASAKPQTRSSPITPRRGKDIACFWSLETQGGDPETQSGLIAWI